MLIQTKATFFEKINKRHYNSPLVSFLGNYRFNIYSTHSSKLKLAFNNDIKPNKNFPIVDINIYLIEKGILYKNIIEYCTTSYDKFSPYFIEDFYKELNKALEKNYSLKTHVNRYYIKNSNIFACFPYSSDNFYIHFSYNDNNIYLLGNENNLNRIILDFLTVSSEYLPFHSSACRKK